MTQRGPNQLAGALLALAISALASAPLLAQTHKVAKPEDVVRAVGVYEWTGDMAKPNASRLIPVSLFIDGKLQDAAVYLARPVPLALLTGNLYEVDQAGVAKGNLDLLYARHLVATDAAATTYDDGWFGYGRYIPPVVPKKSTLKPSRTLAVINGQDVDSSKPHFSSNSASPGSGGSATPTPGTSDTSSTPAGDPDRPTMKRKPDTSDKTASTGSSSSPAPDTPADDPDRPTMKRHPDTSGQTASTGSTGSDSDDSRDNPPDDSDRPTLRRRTPAAAEAAKGKSDQASVTSVGSLNDDPNRPMLHRGKPAGVPKEVDFPKLSGLPNEKDLHQMVAVSDAANRPAHDFSRPWDDEAEHQAILSKMQTAARQLLSAYEAANEAAPPAPAPAPKPDTRRPNSKIRHAVTPDTAPPPPPEALVDEKLNGYLLSYGGAATYVYTAHTDGLGPALRFVTLVAQVNMQGEPEIALKSVTDAAHLDRIARMRLVDVVDAEASNRASLLFELRARNSRQFALYRVIGGRADQIFLTGTTQ